MNNSKDCLIIEENFVISMDLEDIVKSMGFDFIDQATSLTQATELLEKMQYRMAFLDLYLGQESSLPIAEMLKKQNIPFAITTAYHDEDSLPNLLKGIPIIQKPYSTNTVNRVVLELLNSTPSYSRISEVAANL